METKLAYVKLNNTALLACEIADGVILAVFAGRKAVLTFQCQEACSTLPDCC